MRTLTIPAVLTAVTLLTAGPAVSRTWHITPNSTGDGPTIQAGVDSAAPGDTLLLADGEAMSGAGLYSMGGDNIRLGCRFLGGVAAEVGFRHSVAMSGPVEVAGPADEYTFFLGTQLADTVAGTSGDDHIRGLEEGDLMKGLAGNDILDGGWGADIALGGMGDDILLGGPGEDSIEPGPGDDLILAGGGPDAVFLRLQENALDFDRAEGGPGVDRLVLDITGLPDPSGLIAAIRALHEEAAADGVPLDLSSLGFGVVAGSFEELHIFFGPGCGRTEALTILGKPPESEPATWGSIKAMYR